MNLDIPLLIALDFIVLIAVLLPQKTTSILPPFRKFHQGNRINRLPKIKCANKSPTASKGSNSNGIS